MFHCKGCIALGRHCKTCGAHREPSRTKALTAATARMTSPRSGDCADPRPDCLFANLSTSEAARTMLHHFRSLFPLRFRCGAPLRSDRSSSIHSMIGSPEPSRRSTAARSLRSVMGTSTLSTDAVRRIRTSSSTSTSCFSMTRRSSNADVEEMLVQLCRFTRLSAQFGAGFSCDAFTLAPPTRVPEVRHSPPVRHSMGSGAGCACGRDRVAARWPHPVDARVERRQRRIDTVVPFRDEGYAKQRIALRIPRRSC